MHGTQLLLCPTPVTASCHVLKCQRVEHVAELTCPHACHCLLHTLAQPSCEGSAAIQEHYWLVACISVLKGLAICCCPAHCMAVLDSWHNTKLASVTDMTVLTITIQEPVTDAYSMGMPGGNFCYMAQDANKDTSAQSGTQAGHRAICNTSCCHLPVSRCCCCCCRRPEALSYAG